jgi:hypothetical protein
MTLTRAMTAVFLPVRVGDLLPHVIDAVSRCSVARTRYLARWPACDRPTCSFSQESGR